LTKVTILWNIRWNKRKVTDRTPDAYHPSDVSVHLQRLSTFIFTT